MPLAGDNRCRRSCQRLRSCRNSVIVSGSLVPGGNLRWNTSMPGPGGWMPPGIGRGTPAARAPSSGAARCPAHRVPGGAWPCRRAPSVR